MAFRGPWNDPSDKRVLGALGEATGEPTGFFDTSLLTVTWSDSSPDRTLTLTPVNDTFIVYINGVKYLKRTESVQITDTDGVWNIYYNSEGVLTASQTFPTSLTNNALVWVGYWDATNSIATINTGTNELHGTTMGGTVHQYLHHAFGAQYESGLALGNLTVDGDGSSQDHITFSVGNGEFHDEDREIIISDGSPQDLAPIVQIPVFYLEGATPVWRKQAAGNFAVILDGGSGRAAYNENSGGTWQQTAVTSNRFTLVHVFMTNDKDTPIVAVQGQNDYNTKVAASAGADSELAVLYTVGLPLHEWIPIATLIVQTKDSYTNSQKSRYISDIDGNDYIDWRTQQLQAVGASVSNIISAGNSSVSVNDSGTGEVTITADGNEEVSVTDSGLQLGAANARVNAILDEDDMASDSAVSLVTQQSAKKYVDDAIAGISADTISAGDSSVAVVDTGTGEVKFTVDSAEIMVVAAAGLTSKISATQFVVPAAGSLSIKDGDGDNLAIFISNGESRLYHNNAQSYVTTSTGGQIRAGANRFSFVNLGSENYIQTNEHGAPFGLRAENASGSAKKLFDADPDGAAELYHAGTKEVETISGALKATNGLRIAASATNITSFKDEDDMSSDDANAVCSQQSVKAYVDSVRVNAIQNGDFGVWQRGTSFAAIASGSWSADRFLYQKSGSMVHTVSRDTDVPTVSESGHKSSYSIKIDCTTIDASIAASDYCTIAHSIEGYNFAPFVGKKATLSFFVKGTKTGIHCVAFRSTDGSRTYISEYTINTTNTWEKKTITLTFDYSGGTWDYTNGVGLKIWWVLAAGTDYHNTADSWLSASDLSTSNQVNACDNAANNFFLSQVELKISSFSTAFVDAPFGILLEELQRYYQKSYNLGVDPATVTSVGASVLQMTGHSNVDHTMVQNVVFPVIMRAAPTVVSYGDTSGTSGQVRMKAGDVASTVSTQGEKGFLLSGTNGAASVDRLLAFQWAADADI